MTLHDGESFEENDPIERDPRYREIFAKIDEEVRQDLKGHPQKGAMGFCHIYWERKQNILRDKYNIIWKTPQQMNPFTCYD